MNRLTPRFVLFDLDGTLVDSAPGITAALNRALDAHGFRQTDVQAVAPLLGGDAKLLVRRVVGGNGEDLSEEDNVAVRDMFLNLYSSAPAEGSRLFPDALETLAVLKDAGCRLGLCTNKPTKTGVPVLGAFGLAPLFDAVSFGDTGPHKKPDGRHVLATLAMLDADAGKADAVMIGDAANDILAANDAGVRSVLVEFGYDRDAALQARPTKVIGTLAEVPGVLAQI